MKIICKNQDNSIGIITPSDEALSFATVVQLAEKDVPVGLPYWIVEDSVIPADRTFRSAWEIDESMGKPDGSGGESNQFDSSLLAIYNQSKGEQMQEMLISQFTYNSNTGIFFFFSSPGGQQKRTIARSLNKAAYFE